LGSKVGGHRHNDETDMPKTEWFRQRAASSDSTGSILPSVTLMRAVSVCTSVLALDSGRCMNLQTQSQKRADARWQRSFAFDFSLGRALGVWQY